MTLFERIKIAGGLQMSLTKTAFPLAVTRQREDNSSEGLTCNQDDGSYE